MISAKRQVVKFKRFRKDKRSAAKANFSRRALVKGQLQLSSIA
jgi:hypothetical protein